MVSRSLLRKDKQIGLRLNGEELLKVTVLAKHAGLSKSSFLCELVKDESVVLMRGVQNGKREFQLSIRITESDYNNLLTMASERGVSLQNYIRIVIHSTVVPHDIESFIKTK